MVARADAADAAADAAGNFFRHESGSQKHHDDLKLTDVESNVRTAQFAHLRDHY
jgi:hypothetical protein